jgi:hypothetical protein
MMDIRHIEQVGLDQLESAELWQSSLLADEFGNRGADSRDQLPVNIEMTMRNPAVYADRMESGGVSNLPVAIRNRWAIIQRQAGAIAEAQYAFDGIEPTFEGENKLAELQRLASDSNLWLPTGSLVIAHMIKAAGTFGEAISHDHIDDGHLGYFAKNAIASSRLARQHLKQRLVK